MALRDLLLGDPATLDGPGLARGVRRGGEAFAVRCIRALGERDEEAAVDFLLPLLRDERAGVRRAAAASLGHLGRPRAREALVAAGEGDRSEEGRLALAVARVRCGEDPQGVAREVDAHERRVAWTWQGPRSPQAGTGVGGLVDRFWQALGDAPGRVVPRAELRAARVAALARPGLEGAEERILLQALAALRHPDDHERLVGLLLSAGRRGEHALFAGLGMCGDPRALKVLTDALFATDVDPGRGFAQRRLAAIAIGRLGLRESTPLLLRALENEARDYEGRPGAGMGVQYPVRTNLLWALGEVGDPAGVPTLLGYLGDIQGSAFGGFYLPAMDALAKIGRPAVPALRRLAAEGREIDAANAVGVLATLGDDLELWSGDRRGAVAAVVRRSRGG